jgi:chromate reductase, NAD(P)H dehydrogenase (quinone)
MSESTLTILGLAGSLRRLSYNRGLLRAAVELAPCGVRVEELDLAPIPLYNGDDEGERLPPVVADLKARITAADALLLATPEYNHSVSGVLKNAIDWASRPVGSSPLRHKPVAIMGAATGGFGTVRAQLHLRQVLASTQSYVMVEPAVYVSNSAAKFDAEGYLSDGATRDAVRGLVEALASWARRLR